MTVIRTASSTTAGTNVALVDNEALFVGAAATLASTAGTAIVGAFTDHVIVIQGDVVGLTGIRLGADTATGAEASSDLQIAAGGSVTGLFSTGAAIRSFGNFNRITNDGDVFSNYIGIWHEGSGAFDLLNSGTIEGRSFGVYAISGDTDIVNTGVIRAANAIQTIGTSGPSFTNVTLENWGIIEGTNNAYRDGSSAVLQQDIVLNYGIMRGDVVLFTYDDMYDGSAGRLFGSVLGGEGNDTLLGGSFNDRLFGDNGDDSIEGGDGDDHLRGGLGADMLDGGAGLRDLLDYANSDALNINLALNEVQGSHAVGDVISGFEWVAASFANDTVTGDIQANRLFGRGGNDLLSGAAGADVLWGEAGADTLVGGAGVDLLRGGTEADVFRFVTPADSGAPGQVRDRILDFSVAEGDRIDLFFIDADPGTLDNQAFALIPDAVFSATAQVRLQVIGGNTFVFGNTDTNFATAEFSILVMGTPALTASSFIL